MNYNNAQFEKAFGTFEQLSESDLPEICFCGRSPPHRFFSRGAYGTFGQLPDSELPEIAFAGRSNVGKSSLINKVLGRKSIARVSSKPGKTVTINFYKVDNIRLVDLPGYGYAKVPFAEKSRWSELMEGYFGSNRNIKMVFQLIDMRHPATEFDLWMLDFLSQMGYPYTVVLTKADKLNKTESEKVVAKFEELCSNFNYYKIVLTSSDKGTGIEELKDIFEEVLADDYEEDEDIGE